jgi:alanine dehydrogenase
VIEFDADAIRARLPWPRMIEALHAALQSEVVAPLRAAHSIEVPGAPAASLLMMPAWRRGDRVGVKLVTVFPGNAARHQRAVSAVYVLFDANDGRPLALFDGEELTARRTAGASAYAARHLARADARRLLMIGSGRQARGLIAAHCSVRDITHVEVWSRTVANARALVTELTGRGLAAEVCDDLAQGVARSDIVSCATLATEPLLRGEWLREGTHVDLVGAFRGHMREADDAVLRRADLIVVDDRTAALVEGGDVVQAIASGAIDATSIAATLADLARGLHRGRALDRDITVFKSVGFALEDLAAAQAVLEG